MKKQHSIFHDADLRHQLMRLAAQILDSTTLAEEIVQDACLRLLVAEPDSIENPSSWLRTVTRNLALDKSRRRVHEHTLLELIQELDQYALHDDRHATISGLGAIISRLIDVSDAHITAILLLHIVFGVSYEDIAIICGRSSTACRQAARRALRKCRESVCDDEPYVESNKADMYVHAILDATMAPLVDSLEVSLPVSMQSQAKAQSGRPLYRALSKSGRTRQMLVLTTTGVKWALVLDSMVMCYLDKAESASTVNI